MYRLQLDIEGLHFILFILVIMPHSYGVVRKRMVLFSKEFSN